MKQLIFNEEQMSTLNPMDMMKMCSHLFESNFFDNKEKIYVQSHETLEDIDNKLMCKVAVAIQSWKQNEGGEGEMAYWICYRAIDFSCSSAVGFYNFPPMPFK